MKKKYISKTAMMLAATTLMTSCNCPDYNSMCCDRQRNSQMDQDWLYSNIDLPNRPLTLDDLVEIAMQRNLNLLVKDQEYQIQQEVASRARFRMLPSIKFNFEESGRNENTASFSQSLQPGVPPAPLSISSDQHIQRWDMNLVFNLLDFGLSYFRHRQECDRTMIAQLEYQRLKQNVVVDVTRQFWKGVAAKMAMQQSTGLIDKSELQQNNLRRQMESKVISEIQGLRNENQLINIHAQLQGYEKDYHSSIYELAILMGMPPSVDFELAGVTELETNAVIGNLEELEQFALLNRPELFSADLDYKIRTDEVRAAILQMFPGVELFGGPYHDSNSFLLFNNWLAAGVRATWNLLDAPGFAQEKIIGDSRKILARKNRLQLSIGIMSQVHLAYHVYQDNLQSYMLAKDLESVNRRLLLAAQNEQKQGKLHEADIIKYEAELLFSAINTLKSYGEMENALEQLNNSLGMPLYFRNSFNYTNDAAESEEGDNSTEENSEQPEGDEHSGYRDTANWYYKIG